MPTVFITGATGFIGRALCAKMLKNGWKVRGAYRNNYSAKLLPVGVEGVWLDLSDGRDLSGQYFTGVDAVIHLAARVHIMKDASTDPLEAFRKVNVLGTERLTRIAAEYGVRRLIFVSSIGVNGESNRGKPFSENDPTDPYNAYTLSKWEAEQFLWEFARDSKMEIAIIRSPLIYGPDAPGNFARIMRFIKSGMPLPLGNIKNLRSFIYLDNLIDAIITSVTHPLAAGETFLVSDGQDVSTSDLVKMIAAAMRKKTFFFSLHPAMLKVLCKIVRKARELEKLTVTLQVDSGKIRNLLGWKPPFTLEEGIRQTVKEYGKTNF